MKKLDENVNIFTKDGWQIIENEFNKEQKINNGSNFLLGNGYLGYRANFCNDKKKDYVACIVTDTFDKADGKWRELCNVPNGLFTDFKVNGKKINNSETGFLDYKKTLDFQNGLLNIKRKFKNGLKVQSQRFTSMKNKNLIAMKLNLNASKDLTLDIKSGIDGNVWSLNGNHFKIQDTYSKNDLLISYCKTKEWETDIYVVEFHKYSKENNDGEIIEENSSIYRKKQFNLNKGENLVLEKYVSIFTSNDIKSPKKFAKKLINNSIEKGYNKILNEHKNEFNNLWKNYDIEITGSKVYQTLIRFNLYHNIIATPSEKIHPIGARGLSCQAYQGAAFWDQEIFNMPMFLYTNPEIAKNILKYRYDTLNGARKKAKDLGYKGAFYAWISGKTGEELCPDYFFKNVLTGRKIRNHFNNWQIHISPDITYAIIKYFEATDDYNFIKNYGAEMIFEIAKFIQSRVHFKVDKDRYEIIRVLGPDEWHENVDNNLFTNYQSKFALKKAIEIYKLLKKKDKSVLNRLLKKLDLDNNTIDRWKDISKKIYIQPVDEDTKLVEQFDGFFELEDILPKDLEKRLIDPEEYWGWPNGIAVRTQVSKQADVVQLLALHPNLYKKEIIEKNYRYYEKRSRHGSSLSPAMHAVVASEIGDLNEAKKYFEKACTVDLFSTNEAVVGGTFIGGIHTAACGAVWQILINGFAGVTFDYEKIFINPHLIEGINTIKFSINFKSQILKFSITNDIIKVNSVDDNKKDISLNIDGKNYLLKEGRNLNIKY
ncbi:MAG: glycosyl hydrolase family 65 protein [Bacillota bacterium]